MGMSYKVNKENMSMTANGANTHMTTNDECLDFFALGGAMRENNEKEILTLFNAAFESNKLLAMKLLFYMRDIRGGQGERRIFRIILKHLANTNPDVVSKNLELIPEFGRWDDLYALEGTPLEREMFAFIKRQFYIDIKSNTPSLLAKWLKSENASSRETIRLARKTRKALKLSSKQYRKALSRLRRRIGIIERLISENKWSEIEYDKIPSNAGFKYSNAFARHDYERYNEFLDRAKDVVYSESVNADVLYPYEIVRRAYKYFDDWSYHDEITQTERDALEVYWKNLKDYFANQPDNYSAICVVDTSGSMGGTPMEVALSLGLYTAERCKGPFKDTFITFSERPKIQQIVGEDVYEKLSNMSRADWGMNTNIKAVFDLLLNKAVKGGLTQETLPQNIFIISDMEFDYCTMHNDTNTLMEEIYDEWKAKGYEMPHLIFWNVNASSRNIPILGKGKISYVSGFSPSIFEAVLSNKSGYELMMEVLNNKRYDKITV